MTTNDSNDVTRRTVLRAGAVTAGAVTIGAAGAAAHHDDDHDQGGDGENGEDGGSDQKRGGRAQYEGDVRLHEPWQLSTTPTDVARNASCMSAESAEQMYLEYDIEYCNDDDDNDDSLYVIPDEAELAQEEVYEFRAVQQCRASDNQLVAFGPSNSEC